MIRKPMLISRRRLVVGGAVSTALACSTGRPRMSPGLGGAGGEPRGGAAGATPGAGGRSGAGGSAGTGGGGAPDASAADAARAGDAAGAPPADAAGERAAPASDASVSVPSGTIIDVHVH